MSRLHASSIPPCGGRAAELFFSSVRSTWRTCQWCADAAACLHFVQATQLPQVDMSSTVFAPGGYRYIPAVFQYSGGVAAETGFEIVRVHLHRALPLKQGFARIADA